MNPCFSFSTSVFSDTLIGFLTDFLALLCGFCGSKYKGCGNKDERYSYYRATCHCCKKRIRKDDLNKEVLDNIYSIIKSEENINKLTDKVYEKLKLKLKKLNHPANKEALIAKKRNLLKLVEEGALPGNDPDLRERLSQIDAELLSCVGASSSPIINRSDVKRYIQDVGCLTNETALVEAFINRIDVMPDCSYKITYAVECLY